MRKISGRVQRGSPANMLPLRLIVYVPLANSKVVPQDLAAQVVGVGRRAAWASKWARPEALVDRRVAERRWVGLARVVADADVKVTWSGPNVR